MEEINKKFKKIHEYTDDHFNRISEAFKKHKSRIDHLDHNTTSSINHEVHKQVYKHFVMYFQGAERDLKKAIDDDIANKFEKISTNLKGVVEKFVNTKITDVVENVENAVKLHRQEPVRKFHRRKIPNHH